METKLNSDTALVEEGSSFESVISIQYSVNIPALVERMKMNISSSLLNWSINS